MGEVGIRVAGRSSFSKWLAVKPVVWMPEDVARLTVQAKVTYLDAIRDLVRNGRRIAQQRLACAGTGSAAGRSPL
jgi:hypothetical protein